MMLRNVDGLHKKNSASAEPVYLAPEKIIIPEETADTKEFLRPRKKWFTWGKAIFFIVILIVITASLYVSRVLFYKNDGQNIAGLLSQINIFKTISNLITSGDKQLAGEKNDRINFLLLGIGGEGHDGPYLTDTIIFASLQPKEKKVAMVSFPRDLMVQDENNNWQKINAIYTYGLLRNKSREEGLNYFKTIFEKNFNQTINYYVLADFDGFKKIIDTLGGIEVNVERSFSDYSYPLTQDPPSWQTVSFHAGKQKMNGNQALQFARSRHGNNGEGSDFARAKRQQKILTAIKDQVFSFGTLLRPTRISTILTTLNSNIFTNIQSWEAMKIYDLVKNINDSDITNQVLDDGPTNYLYSEILTDGAYALLPKGGNFSAVNKMLENIFQTGQITSEKANVEILNGTKKEGLAYQSSLTMKNLGITVSHYANAPTQDYQTSIIYDLTNGQKTKTLEIIKSQINGYVTSQLPVFLQNELALQNANTNNNQPAPDFIIILGQDQLIE